MLKDKILTITTNKRIRVDDNIVNVYCTLNFIQYFLTRIIHENHPLAIERTQEGSTMLDHSVITVSVHSTIYCCIFDFVLRTKTQDRKKQQQGFTLQTRIPRWICVTSRNKPWLVWADCARNSELPIIDIESDRLGLLFLWTAHRVADPWIAAELDSSPWVSVWTEGRAKVTRHIVTTSRWTGGVRARSR